MGMKKPARFTKVLAGLLKPGKVYRACIVFFHTKARIKKKVAVNTIAAPEAMLR